MATLKREVKKLPSESNLRLLSSLIVSLANKQSSLEDRVIAPWKADVTYQKDISYVSHNGYVYICSVTNQDSAFTESHWVKLSDNITELDVDTIKSYLNLTPEQITTLQSLIDDTTITTTKTNSSSKIYMDIQAAIAECKDDTLKQIAKKVSGSYKIATSTSDVTSADYIYLINNGVNYDLYVLVDSVPTRVGDTSVNLDNYYTKTEINADYLKKTDATSTYATITTVDGKMDNKTIATLIGNDNVETHDQLVSAKAAAELKRRVFSRPSGESILDYADSIDTSNDNISVTVRSMDCPDAPYGTTGTITNDCYYTISKIYNTNDYCVIEAKDIRTNNKYIRMKTAGTWYDWVSILEQGNVVNMCNLPNGGHSAISSWVDESSGAMIMSFDLVDADDKVCRIQFDYVSGMFYSFKYDGTNWISTGHYCITKVDDVPVTEITNFSSNYSSGSVSYMVRNGICYVSVVDLKLKSTGTDLLIYDGMPIPALGFVDALAENRGITVGNIVIDATGKLKSPYVDSSKGLYATFSYPVKES